MKPIKILTVVLLLVNFAFPATQEKYCSTHYYIVEPIKLMPILLKHYRELNLTPEQKEEIKKLIHTIKTKIIPLDKRIDFLTEKVRRDMLTLDNKILVEGEMRVLANLKVERSLYNYICIQALKRSLTKSQFLKLLEIYKNQ